MSDDARRYNYRVQRDVDGPAYADIKLVRYEVRHGLFGSHHESDGTVIFHREFKPQLEFSQLESYASLLERIAQHANEGTFGCYLETESDDGHVEVALYERWFDGSRLHFEQLASRAFDASDETALVKSAEFRGELEQWAEDQNAAREQSYADAADDERERTARATERASAADGLAAILARSAPQR